MSNLFAPDILSAVSLELDKVVMEAAGSTLTEN